MRRLLEHPTVRTHAPQLVKFAVSGGMGFTLDIATLAFLTRVLHFSPEWCFLVSSFVGATFVFFVNKVFTFRNHDAHILYQALKFYSVYGPAIAANFLLSNLLFWFGINDLVAKFIAVGVIAIVNYLLSHHYVFKKMA